MGHFHLTIEAFGRRKSAVVCFWVLIALYAAALFAPVLSAYRFDDEDRDYSYCPPTPVEFFDHGQLVWPFVYGRALTFDENHRRIFTVEKGKKYPLEIFSKGRLLTVGAPGRLYLLGADSRGRDLYSRLLYGARISLSIGLIGVLISFGIGLLVGGIAGYYGGFVDAALMRLCEMFMLVPGFYLMLALRSAVPEDFNSAQVYLTVVVILSFIGWASLARVIRGMALSLRERDYVAAAKLMGLSDAAIIARHILPHTVPYSLVAIMLTIPGYILGEAGLSVLGLGIQDPVPSWGNLLSEAMGIVRIQFAPWILMPGALIFMTVVCFNVVGDALRDALDPMLKNENVTIH
ncbi:MAG: ABC transporter permease [Candidatus Omnitrophica bacterium]|nr:ABC transporter permease [Candidatus Omnitrophota bacterium]